LVGEGELPEHGIRVGDIVIVSEQPAGSAKKREVKELEGKGSRGVVTRVGRSAVWAALDSEEDEVGMKRLWLVKLANDVTYKRYISLYLSIHEKTLMESRMNQTIGRLAKMKEEEVWLSLFVKESCS
jgi:DNA polymerase alpha-associated DNA helicase A